MSSNRRGTGAVRTGAVVAVALTLALAAGTTAVAAPTERQVATSTAGHYRQVDLGTLGGESSVATALNDRGAVVGQAQVGDGSWHGFLWHRGRMQDLGTFHPTALNNRGQISGGRALAGRRFHASVWWRGRVRDLGAAAFDRSNTYRINERGWVIGWTFSAEQFERGALWRHGVRTDLGSLGGNLTRAVALNDCGLVLATSQVADGNLHPALWRRGVLTDLSTLGVDADGEVADLNDRGEIAGSVRPVTGVARAVVYRPSAGRTS